IDDPMLRYMPNQRPSIEQTFIALSDQTRRAVVQALSEGSATGSQLASPFGMALPSFTHHPGVLEKAGLILSRREGRSRVCSLNPEVVLDIRPVCSPVKVDQGFMSGCHSHGFCSACIGFVGGQDAVGRVRSFGI